MLAELPQHLAPGESMEDVDMGLDAVMQALARHAGRAPARHMPGLSWRTLSGQPGTTISLIENNSWLRSGLARAQRAGRARTAAQAARAAVRRVA